jgi:Phage-related protein
MAGFTAYQGMLGLTGVESEELQKTMVKLQAAQSALSGVVQLQTAFQKESAAMTAINTIGTKAYAVAQTVLNFATSAGTKAMKIFRIALISTGIGALVVGVGLLIANFDKVVDAVKNVRDRFNGMGEGFKTVISIIFPFIGIIRLISAGLEALGITENQQERDRRKASENELARNLQQQENSRKRLADLIKEGEELDRKHSFEERMMKAQGASEEDIFKAVRKNRIERAQATRERVIQAQLHNKQLSAEFKLQVLLGNMTKEVGDKINAQNRSEQQSCIRRYKTN